MTDDRSAAFFRLSRPRHISWLTIVLVLLAVGTFIAISQPGVQYYPTLMGGTRGESSGVYPSTAPTPVDIAVQDTAGVSRPDYYYPYPTNVPATDTRELLKVTYNASMQTRDVRGLTRRVETTVRGHSGRIDQESSSEKSGYINFVVPIAKYEAFRTELEAMVPSRFLTVDIQSENLLPQKQSIEEQQKSADSALADAKAARQRLVNAHASTAKSIQAQIDADLQQLIILRAQIQTPQIQAQIQETSDDMASFRKLLADQNTSYSWKLSNADATIKSAQDWQTAVKTQDTALMDNIATVNGTVSIQWISLWDMAQLYLPGYSIPAIFAFLTFLSYLFDRRRFGVANT